MTRRRPAAPSSVETLVLVPEPVQCRRSSGRSGTPAAESSAAVEPLGVTDRGDDVGRRVEPALQDQRAPDAAHRAGRDDPLVHELHRLRAAGPQRVDHGLHVLLVHDDVVHRGALRQHPVGGTRRVVEGHRHAGAGDRRGASGQLEPAGPALRRGHPPVGRPRPGRWRPRPRPRSRSTRSVRSSARRCSARIRSPRSLRVRRAAGHRWPTPALVANSTPAAAKASGVATRQSARTGASFGSSWTARTGSRVRLAGATPCRLR